MRPFPAGEDPHRRRPAVQLVAVRAFAQQPGQLGHVGLFGPAPRMPQDRSAQASPVRRSRTWPRWSTAGRPDRVAFAGAEVLLDLGIDKGFDTLIVPVQEHFSLLARRPATAPP
jgi:hypothetical protein